jgi:hypothetical protein
MSQGGFLPFSANWIDASPDQRKRVSQSLATCRLEAETGITREATEKADVAADDFEERESDLSQ